MLLVGILWIVADYICYRGIEALANFQKALLGIEVGMLLVISVVALVRVGNGHHPAVSLHPSAAWLNPFGVPFSAFASGSIPRKRRRSWDTALSVNEETKDPAKTPGRAAMLSTVILLVTYAVVIFAAQAFAGIGTKGIGLANPAHVGDVISILGSSVVGTSTFGNVLSHLLTFPRCCPRRRSHQTTTRRRA